MRLTIGMPVRNGSQHIGAAVESLLSQTWGDFELCIADNASTDETEWICREYARHDSRIRFIRHERNLGAAENFNFVFRQARGELFKWAAHDDVLAPEYLRECVSLLDRRPDAVVSHSLTIGIDDSGAPICRHTEQLPLQADRPSRRLAALFRTSYPVTIWGVMPRAIVARTQLHGSYLGSDWTFMAEMLIQGRVALVPEYLFCLRHHSRAFSSTQVQRTSKAERLAWFNPSIKAPRVPTAVVSAMHLTRAIARHQMSTAERAACLALVMARFCRRAGARLGIPVHCIDPESINNGIMRASALWEVGV